MSKKKRKNGNGAFGSPKHLNQYNSKEEAIEANKGVDKEEWLKAVANGIWAVGHYNSHIVFKYRNNIKPIRNYVKLIPDADFGKFVTLYGAYLKEVMIAKYGSKEMKAQNMFPVYLDAPSDFFPKKYNGLEWLEEASEIFQMTREMQTQDGQVMLGNVYVRG